MYVKWVMVFAIAVVLLTAEAHQPTLTQNDPYYPKKMESSVAEKKKFVGQRGDHSTDPKHGKGCHKNAYDRCKPPMSD